MPLNESLPGYKSQEACEQNSPVLNKFRTLFLTAAMAISMPAQAEENVARDLSETMDMIHTQKSTVNDKMASRALNILEDYYKSMGGADPNNWLVDILENYHTSGMAIAYEDRDRSINEIAALTYENQEYKEQLMKEKLYQYAVGTVHIMTKYQVNLFLKGYKIKNVGGGMNFRDWLRTTETLCEEIKTEYSLKEEYNKDVLRHISPSMFVALNGSYSSGETRLGMMPVNFILNPVTKEEQAANIHELIEKNNLLFTNLLEKYEFQDAWRTASQEDQYFFMAALSGFALEGNEYGREEYLKDYLHATNEYAPLSEYTRKIKEVSRAATSAQSTISAMMDPSFIQEIQKHKATTLQPPSF